MDSNALARLKELDEEIKTLRGIESQGMLLAASDDSGKLVIVGPEAPIAVGAKVR